MYVRIRNKSCVDAVPDIDENVTLYWSKAATALSWPNHWDGSITSPALMGEPILTLPIGNLKAGEEKISMFPWSPPDPANYSGVNEPWHFCLLARIVSNNDPMTYPEVSTLWQNVKNNNNIAWKNLEIIRKSPISKPELGLGGVIAIGNDEFSSTKTIDLMFEESTMDYGDPLYEDAEITVRLDEDAYEKWMDGEEEVTGMVHLGDGVFRISDETASLKNMTFLAGERATLYLGINFLTDEIGEKVVYKYHVEQYENGDGGEFIGGEQYLIHRDERDLFYADAGSDQLVQIGQPVSLQANSIGELASYNWYNEAGELIYSGMDTSFIPTENTIYTLEVIAHADGFKDYDEKKVELKEYYISSIFPNPSNSNIQLTVNYEASKASSAYLTLSNSTQSFTSNYIINPSQTSTSINIGSIVPGVYTLFLVCDGVTMDSKILTIN